MVFEFGKYIVDIDVEKTREFYDRADKITDNCNCSGCRNYENWAASTSIEIKHILQQMGAQMEKADEVYVNCINEDGSVSYGGFYHFCGRILQGAPVWNATSEMHKVFNEVNMVQLCDGCQAAFTEDISLLEMNFPAPVIQMEILINIPWVLPERCDY